MYLTNICLLCYGDAESIHHILIHCPFVTDIWNAMMHKFDMNLVILSNITTLLSSWKTRAFNLKGKVIWSMVPVAVWWSMWRERNNRVFENAAEPLIQVFRKAKNLLIFWARRCKDCADDFRVGLLWDWKLAIGLY